MRVRILTLAFLLVAATRAEAQVRPDPGASSAEVEIGRAAGSPAGDSATRSASRCLEPREGSYAVPAIEFEGRRFEPVGSPEPISTDNLDALGEDHGLPLFAGKLSGRPVVDLWVPVCAPADHYQLYTRPAPGHASAGS